MTRLVGAVTGLVIVAVAIAGCAASLELEPAPVKTSQAAEPTETPTPTPTPFVPDCRNIISDEAEDTLEAEGFVLIEEHENKLRVERRVEAMFYDNGGVDCLWGIAAGGDSLVSFGYSEISATDASTAQAELESIGYVRSDEAGDIVLSVDPSMDVMGVGDVFVFSGDEWFHANTREAIAEIRTQVSAQKAR